MQTPIITLTTDFGLTDTYVAAMKAVILNINPALQMVDVTHNILSFNISEGAYQIASVYSYFPKGTIHLVVVDPGVGSARWPVLLVTEDYYFIAPDNGVLSLILQREKITGLYHLNNEKYFLKNATATFHGRDIFAPIAGHLASGKSPADLGTRIDSIMTLKELVLQKQCDALKGRVVHIDHFGNVVTNILASKELCDVFAEIRIGWQQVTQLSKTYSDVPAGHPLTLVGSSGYFELSIHQGNYAKDYHINLGQEVSVVCKSGGKI